jgi:pyruvate formate-lyase/glycerol dehydratase family glycyl radical enzyme
MSEVRSWRTAKLNEELINVKPEMCADRARLVTLSYQETEGEPMVIRRAKAMKKVLEEMNIFIQKDQMIVGTQASKLRAVPVFPETEAAYIRDEIDLFETREQDRIIIPKEVRKELLEEIIPYWENRTIQKYVHSALPDDIKEIINLENQIFSVDIHISGSIGHVICDYEKVLKLGFKGIREEAERLMNRLDMTNPDHVGKHHFYKAGIILCDAMIAWAKRYAELARKLALEETDQRLKAEYEMIADICEKVPENPASNFREAIQSFWFAHVMLYIEQNGLAVSVGRFDQYMYPYYKDSIEKGEITKAEAQELLECLWIKFTEVMRAYNYECAKYYAGFSISENLVIGGMDRQGNCCVNELSYMCLDAEKHTNLSQPNLSFRYNNNTPDDFLSKAVEVVSTGRTKPEFFNDAVAIPTLMSDGVTLEDARDYSISGCVEAVPPHCNGMTNAAMSNIAKALEYAMNDGKCRLSGLQVGPKTGDPNKFENIDQLIEAFETQVAWYVEKMVAALNIIEKIHADYFPLPYFSLIMDDCMEKGVDITAGGARYNFTGPQAVGLADVANSLAAIQKFVFEEKSMTIKELNAALDQNFEGNEVLRQKLINKAPKWGNDDDYVDRFAVEVANIYCKEVSKYKNTRGGNFRPGIYSVSGNVPLGLHVGATPNGRFSNAPLADGIGPQHGTDKYGPLAVTRSAAKLNHEAITNGTILNQKFTPKLLENQQGKDALKTLIKTYFEKGGWHIQFNVVSAETLREAQKNPEANKGLIIRVAGYSAFFVELDRAVQDDIINRTENAAF